MGSHILALVRRRLPRDLTQRYNTTPVLIETFVETPRFTGRIYRASGWIHVGTTRGRGRYDTHRQYGKPRKDVWLRPLAKHWKRIRNQKIQPAPPRLDRTLTPHGTTERFRRTEPGHGDSPTNGAKGDPRGDWVNRL